MVADRHSDAQASILGPSVAVGKSGDLQDLPEITNDVRGVEVDRQFLQHDAMDGDGEEAGDSCRASVFVTWACEEERL